MPEVLVEDNIKYANFKSMNTPDWSKLIIDTFNVVGTLP